VAIDMFKDDRDIKTAYMINPEVIYMPEDNLKFILGCFIIDGDKDTTLYGFSNIDEGYFKVSLYF
jgi:peptide deformylase